MRWKHWFLGSFFLMIWLLLQTTAVGQTFDLDARRWFPLELGNYWHYSDREFTTLPSDAIMMTKSDTLVNRGKWVQLVTVDCRGPSCPGRPGWYHFTDDYYLLVADFPEDFARADTVLPMQPKSIFAVDVEQDTLWTSQTDDPVVVSLQINDVGNEADSTHLTLSYHANFFFNGEFIYKIGDAHLLIGAIVNGIRFGDTSEIERELPVEVPDALGDPDGFQIDVYPTPFTTRTNIVVSAGRLGAYEMDIYDMLGRHIYRTQKQLLPGQQWQQTWTAAGLSSGVYFVYVTREGSAPRVAAMTLLK